MNSGITQPFVSSEVETPVPTRAGPSTALGTNGTVGNSARGEASIRVGGAEMVLRPSFAALVAAEGELGSLFALVERAAAGGLMLSEIVALFWYCLVEREAISREQLGDSVVAAGLSGVTPALKILLRQILSGA